MDHQTPSRKLIVHADDLGMCHSVNAATFRAIESGAVTSASVIVPGPWFREVVDYARSNLTLDLGLHLAITCEWKHYRWAPMAPRSSIRSLLAPDGFFWPDVESVVRRGAAAEVDCELRAQVDFALDAGLRPSHLDTHMFALFRSSALIEVLERISADYRIPALHPVRSRSLPSSISVLNSSREGDAAQRVLCLRATLDRMGPGIHQLIVHCGFDDQELRAITAGAAEFGSQWRQRDTDLLLSDEFACELRAANCEPACWTARTATAAAGPS